MNFRADIQGLRAIAVIAVVIFHLNRDWLPGGFVGVDMFFVISGFLISRSLIKQKDAGSIRYFDFMFSRIKRIVPAYYLMLIICAICAIIILIPSDAETFLYQLRRTFIFTSNQVFVVAEDYFGAKSYENSLLHTWSLSIEMQFYLILPLIISILPVTTYKKILGVILVIILIYTQYQIDVLNNKVQMYFSVFVRSAEFIIGIAINFCPSSLNINKKYKTVFSFVALFCLLISCFIINENSSFPGVLALPVCISTAFLIWSENSKINDFLGSKFIVFIGKISYSIYLWHWPILALYRYYSMRYLLNTIEIILVLLLTIVFSIISFYLVEEPFRKLNKMKFFMFAIVLLPIIIIAWFFAFNYNQKQQTTFQRSYTSNAAFDNEKNGRNGHYRLMGDLTKPDDKILLIGDSHGLVMTSFFNVVGKINNFNFSYFTINSIVPLEGVNDSIIFPAFKKQYYDALPQTNKLINQSKIIFVIKHWHGDKNRYYKDVLQKLINKLSTKQKLVIVSDFPAVRKHPLREYRSITKNKVFKRQPIVFPLMPYGVDKLIDKYSNVYYLNLEDKEFFKDAPYYNDTLMYSDESHINNYGSMKYAKFKGQKLADLIKQLQK